MINRENWKDVREWLEYLERMKNKNPGTLKKNWQFLRHLIEWADEKPLPQARLIDPTFPVYLATLRKDGTNASRLVYSSVVKGLAISRSYFEFARKRWHRYRPITESWIETLQPTRLNKPEPTLKNRRYYTLEEVRKMLSVSTETLREQRAKAGAALLFLSGMRVDSLASMPRRCLDLHNLRVFQVPSMGIRTKNSKAKITYLLKIEDLIQTVQDWENVLNEQGFASDTLWYTSLSRQGEELYPTSIAPLNRKSMIAEDIMLLCEKANIDYLSPHNFRHGHIVYARSFARTADQLKAISENVMHSSTQITDRVYANLKPEILQGIITSLGDTSIESGIKTYAFSKEDTLKLIELLKRQLA